MNRFCLAAVVIFSFCSLAWAEGDNSSEKVDVRDQAAEESLLKETAVNAITPAPEVNDSGQEIALAESKSGAKTAMFGLSWGMTPTEVRELGSRLKPEKKTSNLYIYSTDSLPSNLQDTGSYKLVFSKNGNLVKIIMIGNKIANDIFGEQGKSRFNELGLALSQKYQEISSIMEIGVRAYDGPDEFYQCLACPGCGLWVKKFQGDNKHIALQIIGIKKGEGYIAITVEAVPEWDFAREAGESIAVVEDADAL